jgi:hypothetical protein
MYLVLVSIPGKLIRGMGIKLHTVLTFTQIEGEWLTSFFCHLFPQGKPVVFFG